MSKLTGLVAASAGSAITAALSHLAAVARGYATDVDGEGLRIARQHAVACGASHAQISAAMRQGA